MLPNSAAFERSIDQHIALNRLRTPTQRFLALCELLDTVRAMAPADPEARQRRLRALGERQRDRERHREHFRRLIAGQR